VWQIGLGNVEIRKAGTEPFGFPCARGRIPGEWAAPDPLPRLMLFLYRLLFIPATILLAPVYLRRMMRRGGYGEQFGDRFGGVAVPPRRVGVRRIWLQAVSVGEILAIGSLIDELTREESLEIYLSTTTSTGFQLARERYGSRVIGIGYFPLDGWFFSRRAWRRIDPDLAILTEGERWPEHVHQAELRGVPCLAINARISDRSFQRMYLWRPFVRPLLRGITRVLAASALDATRFAELGFPRDRISVTGNLKLDVAIPELGEAERDGLRSELGLPAGPVLLGSSTWPGEEEALVAAWRQARKAMPGLSLLLVPRHAERRAEIEALLRQEGVTFHLRSHGPSSGPVEVAVGDTTGELRKFTQLAEVVFVGKSLPPHTEGQTPVEAAALGKPILFGPGMSNFQTIADDLLECGAAEVVSDSASLGAATLALLGDEPLRQTRGSAARAWHEGNRGARERTARIIREELAAGRVS